MQELGQNFNDLLACPSRPDSRGVGRSGAAPDKADGGSAASVVPMDQEAKGESKGSPDVLIVQANPSARQGAAGRKWLLEDDVAAGSEAVHKRPRQACTLRSGKRCPNYLHVV